MLKWAIWRNFYDNKGLRMFMVALGGFSYEKTKPIKANLS
jgi:hypothetical protein